MANLRETAQAYESTLVGNISELSEVPVEADIIEKEGTNDEGKVFPYKAVVIEGQLYRIPNSVIKSLKAILEDNPNLKKFKVRKSGTGMGTVYTVIPLG